MTSLAPETAAFKGKGAGVGKTVRTRCPGRDAGLPDGCISVEEKKPVSAVLDIYQIADTIFNELYFCIKWFPHKAPIKAPCPPVSPDLSVAALVNTSDMPSSSSTLTSFSRISGFRRSIPSARDSTTSTSEEIVVRDRPEEICFAENQAAAAGYQLSDGGSSPGIADAHFDKSIVDDEYPFAGKHPHGKLEVGVDKTTSSG